MVSHGAVDQFIGWAEEGLRTIHDTPFHTVLGLSFDHLIEPAADYLASFFEKASSLFPVRSMYFEMNGFEINPDCWFFSGFAYETGGTIWDPDWLADWNYEAGDIFVLSGMESVQDAYAKHFIERDGEVKSLQIEVAESIASHLVCAHYISLIAKSHRRAKLRDEALRGLQVVATAHDWDRFGESR